MHQFELLKNDLQNLDVMISTLTNHALIDLLTYMMILCAI